MRRDYRLCDDITCGDGAAASPGNGMQVAGLPIKEDSEHG
jgi:hypothetical protein